MFYLLDIIMDNALHNAGPTNVALYIPLPSHDRHPDAAAHGEENGHVQMTWSEIDGRLVASLENNPGPNHEDAMQLQTLHGTNYLFHKVRLNCIFLV